MNRSKIVTIGLFLLSLGVVSGGWYLTRALLEQRREAFLGRTGEILLQPLESALFSAESETAGAGDDTGEATFQEQSLSEEMMAKVLAVWKRGGRVIPHEPGYGQMNMEQAIGAGWEWVTSMAEHGVIPAASVEGAWDNVTARLCTLEGTVDFDENLVSYWDMRFIVDNAEINLTLHAVSGEIWMASIRMDESECLWHEYRHEELLRLAFPFMEEGEQIMTNLEENITSISLREGLVSASVSEAQIQIFVEKPLAVIMFKLSTR